MKYPVYPEYKPSGVEWLGDVPKHWDVKRLKVAAIYRVSNVDKVPADDEEPIRLCNYTDVYYNNYITPDMELMETTATIEEIKKFALKVDDVVITKDSESWDDIAIPALVIKTSPDLVCGYHLAIVRADKSQLLGKFLFRLFQACAVNQQFQISATGVTRYGLPKSAIGEAWIPYPPIDEQRIIATYLEGEMARIDTLITKKRELIEKLKEKRMSLISRTVTRGLPPDAAKAVGLDPNPKLKSSGIDWLGDVPEHWVMPPLYLRYDVKLGKMLDESRITGQCLIPYLRNVDVQWDSINFSELPEMDISKSEYRRYTIQSDDLLVCEGGEVGRAAIVKETETIIGYQKALHRLRALLPDETPRFMFYTLYWAANTGIFSAGGISTIAHLTSDYDPKSSI
ncbi:MAG: restriction endonuclease subunit S [Gammaproteobacteria bacterium]|nr:restriction endonuclease subunit S [Gammaproteobacteria bacterium]